MTDTEQVKRLNDLVKAALNGSYDLGDAAGRFDGEIKELYLNIIELIKNQKNFVTEAQVTSSQIMSASEDLSLTLEDNDTFMQELGSGAKGINKLNNINYKSTADAIETIKEIIANIEKVRGYTDGAKEVGSKAEQAINDGMKRIYDIIGLISEIEEGTEQTVKYVDKFSESTKKIAKILKVVHDISRETEILSFNASIESKRAGVEGKGFGVIAGSIRDLAEKSRQEVTEIGEVIEDINSGLKTLTENIHNDFKRVEQSVNHTKTVEEGLTRIRETFTKLSGSINGITGASQAQNVLASEINGKISDIEKNSQLVNEGFNSVYSSIKKQKNSMDALNSLGKYLLGSASDMAGIVKSFSPEDDFDKSAINATVDEVFELLSREVLSDPMFSLLDPDKHKGMLDNLLTHDIIEAAWSNDEKGRFIYSNPPAGIKNARVRGWFKESIAGRKFTSEVYISAITKKPCVTVSLPIEKDGDIVGVIGVDLRLKE